MRILRSELNFSTAFSDPFQLSSPLRQDLLSEVQFLRHTYQQTNFRLDRDSLSRKISTRRLFVGSLFHLTFLLFYLTDASALPLFISMPATATHRAFYGRLKSN